MCREDFYLFEQSDSGTSNRDTVWRSQIDTCLTLAHAVRRLPECQCALGIGRRLEVSEGGTRHHTRHRHADALQLMLSHRGTHDATAQSSMLSKPRRNNSILLVFSCTPSLNGSPTANQARCPFSSLSRLVACPYLQCEREAGEVGLGGRVHCHMGPRSATSNRRHHRDAAPT